MNPARAAAAAQPPAIPVAPASEITVEPGSFDAALARAQAELDLASARETLARGEALPAQCPAAEQAISKEEAERRSARPQPAQQSAALGFDRLSPNGLEDAPPMRPRLRPYRNRSG